MKKTLLIILFAINFYQSLTAIDRRREQYLTNEGYLAIPVPYSLPGIGQGIMGILFAGNFNKTTMDAYGLLIFGDAEGSFAAIEELPVFTNHLFLTYQRIEITKFAVQQYSTRGMNSDKDDFTLLVGDRFKFDRYRLSANFWERRLDFYVETANVETRGTEIKDKDGNTITDIENPEVESSTEQIFGFALDYTDDLIDPKKGVRAEFRSFRRPEDDPDLPDYSTLTYNFSAFIPIFSNSTWGFNYFFSEAAVNREGLTDLAQIEENSGINCDEGDSECEQVLNETVQNSLNFNRNGSAIPLGGADRLRAYPNQRFQGAFSQYFGTEIRLNTDGEAIPFDIGFMKDIQSALQVAFFWEQGSVSETRDTLGDESRTSYGIGARLITGSGAIYRADFATGDEGSQTTVIFEYPWGIFF